jgi:hypothetical protein
MPIEVKHRAAQSGARTHRLDTTGGIILRIEPLSRAKTLLARILMWRPPPRTVAAGRWKVSTGIRPAGPK